MSRQGMPEGACWKGRAFSSAVWGAWSLERQSMVPSRRPSISRSVSAAVLIDGLTRSREPTRAVSSWVK